MLPAAEDPRMRDQHNVACQQSDPCRERRPDVRADREAWDREERESQLLQVRWQPLEQQRCERVG